MGDFFVHSFLGYGVEKMAETYHAWVTKVRASSSWPRDERQE